MTLFEWRCPGILARPTGQSTAYSYDYEENQHDWRLMETYKGKSSMNL